MLELLLLTYYNCYGLWNKIYINVKIWQLKSVALKLHDFLFTNTKYANSITGLTLTVSPHHSSLYLPPPPPPRHHPLC